MTVEIKVQCDCGTRYAFDVEPLHGRMPQKISCPGCGVDGTPAANAQLRAKLAPTAPLLARERRGGFTLGVVGAVVAGVVAMLAWFFLIKVTGHQLGFAAWGVGLLIGLGARGLAREGSRRLGLAAGACALMAIVAGQVLAAQGHTVPRGGLGWFTPLWLIMAVLSAFKLAASPSVAR